MDKIIQVTRSSLPPIEEYVEEISSIWESRWLTNFGEKHEQLRALLKEYLGVENISLGVNGHMCLEAAVEVLGLTGEVITTPFTFISTTNSILRKGLTPVFCDIRESDFTMDPDQIESLITPSTSAIMPVHVYGNICDVERIDSIAKKHGLRVIYDAAHAFGETYKGVGVGNYGDISMFSFHATKVFNSIEGGGLTYKDASLERPIQIWSNFGIKGPEEIIVDGGNYKMNEFAAAMGLCNLRHAPDYIESRKEVYRHYKEGLSGVEGIRLNEIQADVESNYAYYPIIVDENVYGHNRDELFDELDRNGIKARKYFYPLTSASRAVVDRFDVGNTPVALKISNSVLTLPMYEGLEESDIQRICRIIREYRKV